MAELDERCTLIARFVKERPSLDAIRARLGAMLRIEGEIQIGSLNRQSIMMRFDSESDYKKAWQRGQVVIDGAKAWITKWTPDWCATRDSPNVLAWIELPNLPLHLFNFQSISYICSPIGRAIDLDAATDRKSRPSVAKVRLEIYASKPRLDGIWIEIVNGGGLVRRFWQRIEYDRSPWYCAECGRFGHEKVNCWKLTRRGEAVVVTRGEEGGVSDGGATAVSGETGGGLETEQEAMMISLEVGPGQKEGPGPDATIQLEKTQAEINKVVEPTQGSALKGEQSSGDLAARGRKEKGLNITPTAKKGTRMRKVSISSASSSTRDSISNRVSNASFNFSLSFSAWIEKVKDKMGDNDMRVQIIEDARREAVAHFERMLGELGWDEYEKRKEEVVMRPFRSSGIN